MNRCLLAIALAAVCSPLAIPHTVVHTPFVKPMSAAKCLAWVLSDEARGEPPAGKRAVLDVILTRMKKRKMGACQVIAQKSQFSGYRRGVLRKVGEEELDEYWKISKMKPVVKGCDFFHAYYVTPAWASSMVRCKAVGKQIFYREK